MCSGKISSQTTTTTTTTTSTTSTTTPTTTTTTPLPPGVGIKCYGCSGTDGTCTDSADEGKKQFI